MPRTKRTSKNSIKQTQDYPSIDKETRKQGIETYFKEFDLNCKFLLETIDCERDAILKELEEAIKQFKTTVITPRLANTILEDLPKVSAESTHFITVSDTTSQNNILEITNAVKSVRTRKKRTASVADDEGYVTAESSGRSSRSHRKQNRTKVVRVSRSLSRNKISQSQLPLLKTPINKAPPNYGFVTPKIKPNTPQVILRRPKEGEMAISMQGSPLMVNTIVSQEANVNIPLADGRTISIQPQHGLRMSQLPIIDSSIKRQIEVLRDNLIKVCELGNLNKKK
ncbi:australin isoform a-related [Holotrichia oblita]|uniref:Australin isoform a-related n=1 Tax=Holotrichia oblita TaxID=644536 RepID=A0ACB9TMF5_HOLOL|nr:australin isoform a-related [Holotrichia oblita]